jgi:hypothetical protein
MLMQHRMFELASPWRQEIGIAFVGQSGSPADNQKRNEFKEKVTTLQGLNLKAVIW